MVVSCSIEQLFTFEIEQFLNFNISAIVQLNICSFGQLFNWTIFQELVRLTIERLFIWAIVHLNNFSRTCPFVNWTIVHLGSCSNEQLFIWAIVQLNNSSTAITNCPFRYFLICAIVHLGNCLFEQIFNKLAVGQLFNWTNLPMGNCWIEQLFIRALVQLNNSLTSTFRQLCNWTIVY
jgi:hypothetical protein